MSFLSSLYQREKIYGPCDNVRRYDIIKHLLHAHSVFKKNASEKIWRDIEIEYLHLAIMYVDVYLSLIKSFETNGAKKALPNEVNDAVAPDVYKNTETKKYDNRVIAAGCYLLAYKYECDWFECEFIDFLQAHKWIELKPVLSFEWDLIQMLDWKVNLVTPYSFICEYAKELGIKPYDAGIISLKLVILEPCTQPSRWGVVSLAIVDDAALKYFNVSKQDVKEIHAVYQLLKDGWKQYKKENPELRKVLSQPNT